jgi:hypothetical protein
VLAPSLVLCEVALAAVAASALPLGSILLDRRPGSRAA